MEDFKEIEKLFELKNIDKTDTVRYLRMAAVEALNSTCLRRKYGAVLAFDKTVFGVGHNRSIDIDSCELRGTCWRDENNIPHGQNYEKCHSIHAEQVALMHAHPHYGVPFLYLVGYDCKEKKFIKAKPCYICAKLLIEAGLDSMWTVDYDVNGDLVAVNELVKAEIPE